jgi:hypothetical protein
MSTSELNECQPIFSFRAPADAQAASFGEPAQGAFNHPAPGGVLRFTRNRADIKGWFTPAPPVFDMSHITRQFNKLMNIRIIIATIHAEMLLNNSRVRAWHNNRDTQLRGRPLIMTIRAGRIDRQGRTPLIDQQVDFAPLFTPVCRVSPGGGAAQWSRAALAVEGLPVPLDRALSGIEPDHDLHHPGKRAVVLPGLKTRMQRAAAHPKPVFVDRFPLAACPQHIPDAVQDCAIVGWRAAWSPLCRRLWKHLSDLPPQGPRHVEVVDIFRFWGSILAHSTSRFRWVGRTPILSEMCSFFTLQSFYG